MEYGSMFGDGAARGPDFTAEALHLVNAYMIEFYLTKISPVTVSDIEQQGIEEQVKKEIGLGA